MSSSSRTSNHVYIRDEEEGWLPARVISMDGSTVKVHVDFERPDPNAKKFAVKNKTPPPPKTISLDKYDNRALPLQNVNEEGHLQIVSDMVDLPFLHEPAILYNLKARHEAQLPYTRTGDIMIAVNPYVWLNDIYSIATRVYYSEALVWNNDAGSGASLSDVDPHVYEVSSLAYRGLAMDGQNQSVLVSGESGAGKTETVKILMSHLASIVHPLSGKSCNNDDTTALSPIVERVLECNPLLEAFGNAKTTRNDNSSRFGKYLQLQFDVEDVKDAVLSNRNVPFCTLAGSTTEVYLLEKSRVVSHEQELERAYHVFYQLLAAPTEDKQEIWPELLNCDMESFTYVGYTDVDTIEGKTDGERYLLTKAALAKVGIAGDVFVMLMRTLCIVLQLGNQTFDVKDDDDEASEISSAEELALLSQLMGVSEPDICLALTERTIKTRHETLKVPLKPDKAKESCDALAKEIYAKTFLWLVRTMNEATCAEKNYDDGNGINPAREFGVIGLLDIFGFESFVVNRFEQLCINYANEKLQQKFTHDIFQSVQSEYEFEGIALGEIAYEDNVDVLHLVEGRMGLIAVLNEECVRPKGSDTAFVSKIQTMNKDSDVLIIEKSFRNYEFGIQHYAGKVVYDANFFVNKNMDRLPIDLLECAKKSSNAIISKELENDSMTKDGATPKKKKAPTPMKKSGSRRFGGGGGGGGMLQHTVWTKFRQQLASLMKQLGETRTRYIRCIKPNTEKKPRLMMHLSTMEQLRCAGVVAAVTISRSAFPNRLEHIIVLDRFKSLWTGGGGCEMDDSPQENVDKLLTCALKSLETTDEGNVRKAFVIGKTRTYFRAGALEHLEAQRLKSLGTWAMVLQRYARGFVQRSKYMRKRTAAVRAVAKMRQFIKRRVYLRMRMASIIIQNWVRCRYALHLLVLLKRHDRATRIQKEWRMVVARASWRKHRRATVLIQAMVRGAIQRPLFREALHEKREEAKMENQVKILQRKLEEAEKRLQEEAQQPVRVVYKDREGGGPQQQSQAPMPPTDGGAGSVGMSSAGQLTAQQQTLMDESGKMLEYLRKEVFKLRTQNAQLRNDFDLLKENNQRLMDANASAGASFAMLNQHAKTLTKANNKLTAENAHLKAQNSQITVTQVEIKEELKMKQATYVAEVHSRLQYQKTMAQIVDMIQERCRDQALVEDVLDLSDECEAEYMDGPTGMNRPSLISSLRSPPPGAQNNDSGMLSRFKNFFS